MTAAANRDVLAGGAVLVPFTDLANPVSNAIYQRMGYPPVEDRRHVEFTGPPSNALDPVARSIR